MANLISIGEILIDLTQVGVTELGIPKFVANPGGAPANAAVAASKLGADAGFIGCIGKDAFGNFLRQTLLEQGVDISGLRETEQAPTTLAVVSVDAAGERSFQFYRKPGADICLEGEFAETARERGYLRPGSCKSGLRPLLKYLAALPGDAVDQSMESILCGKSDSLMCRWPVSVKAKDRQGREMRPAILPQTVPDGMALILTPHEGSFDSRYFGLVPLASLQKAEEVLCF